MTPYTYLISWSKVNTHYYGVRYASGCSPLDLWKTYFTSSKYVEKFILEHGQPDIIQIRKIFTSVDTARLWESRVLKKLKVKTDDRFLNKTDNISMPLLKGKDHPKFGKKFIFSQIHKDNIAKSRIGIKGSFTGLNHTIETKNKISLAKIAKPKMVCEKCGKNSNLGNYFRWHGENCGVKKSSGTQKMIKINNTIYKSMGDAASALNVCNATITYRIHSTNFNYSYVENTGERA